MEGIDHTAQAWHTLSDRMVTEVKGVERGKMMSADALTFAGKVFVFFSTKALHIYGTIFIIYVSSIPSLYFQTLEHQCGKSLGDLSRQLARHFL